MSYWDSLSLSALVGLGILFGVLCVRILITSSKESRLKSLDPELYQDLLFDILRQPPYPLQGRDSKHIERDILTVRSRVANEGVSFLTKGLPRFGKEVLLAIEEGSLLGVPGFKPSVDPALPAFLQVVLRRIFDANGALRLDSDPLAVRHLEQVCFMFYKLDLPHSPHDEEKVIRDFVATEDELKDIEIGGSGELLVVTKSVISDILLGYNPEEFRPKHGPGATATGEQLERKWQFNAVYAQLEESFPYIRSFTAMDPSEGNVDFGYLKSLKPRFNGSAKVILVPKDSRGPRLISCEPLSYQWAQQAISAQVTRLIEQHPLSAGHVNFRDQGVNGLLALQSSLTLSHATLDLKEASDRVSLYLVQRVFPPKVRKHLEATRSVATVLPSGEYIPLRKFAPMGSALCFPVLSLTVFAVSVASIVLHHGKTMQEASRHVYVFGDDLIISSAYVQTVVDALEEVGLKLNYGKCYSQGPYRESCGVNAFKGVNTTPTRFRKSWTGRSSDASVYAAWCAYANALSVKGYTSAAERVFEILSGTYGKIPYGTERSSYPCRVVDSPAIAELLNEKALKLRRRWRKDYQRDEFRVQMVTSEKRDIVLDDYPRLLRGLVTRYQEVDPSVVVLPHSTKIKWGWASV